MGKGKRLRQQRAASPDKVIVYRPPAIEVDPPSLAKRKRHDMRAGFREWRKLPLAMRRDPFTRPDDTDTTEEQK